MNNQRASLGRAGKWLLRPSDTSGRSGNQTRLTSKLWEVKIAVGICPQTHEGASVITASLTPHAILKILQTRNVFKKKTGRRIMDGEFY